MAAENENVPVPLQEGPIQPLHQQQVPEVPQQQQEVSLFASRTGDGEVQLRMRVAGVGTHRMLISLAAIAGTTVMVYCLLRRTSP